MKWGCVSHKEKVEPTKKKNDHQFEFQGSGHALTMYSLCVKVIASDDSLSVQINQYIQQYEA